ncbi:MAG: hypothetical protein LBE10_04390 [Treponema sp.]|nr:hypothetical protein [Treponema sp.]
MNEISMDDLFGEAKDAALKAYSRFRAGAAFLTKDGSVITGCNFGGFIELFSLSRVWP